MKSDHIDNWDRLPASLKMALEPVIARFDSAADILFDRRLNISFEAAVKELSIPGIALLTEGLRLLQHILETRISIADPACAMEVGLLFDDHSPITAYDLPLYTPCLYLSQVAQAMEDENVRVWKESTAREIIAILLAMARCIPPDVEMARVCTAAIVDMTLLYPVCRSALATHGNSPNAARIATEANDLLTQYSFGETMDKK